MNEHGTTVQLVHKSKSITNFDSRTPVSFPQRSLKLRDYFEDSPSLLHIFYPFFNLFPEVNIVSTNMLVETDNAAPSPNLELPPFYRHILVYQSFTAGPKIIPLNQIMIIIKQFLHRITFPIATGNHWSVSRNPFLLFFFISLNSVKVCNLSSILYDRRFGIVFDQQSIHFSHDSLIVFRRLHGILNNMMDLALHIFFMSELKRFFTDHWLREMARNL